MKTTYKTLVILFVLILSAQVFLNDAQAQVPRAISYQGVIHGTDGKIVSDGPHTITITMYETRTGQIELYQKTEVPSQ
jgi:hypothetical protein